MNDYKTMRFVDRVGGNYLYRGGAPILDDGTYDKDLPTALRNADKSIQLPPRFYLVIICLLHPNADDDPTLIAELNYFSDKKQGHQDIGEVHFWDTLGTDRCYFTTPEKERGPLLRSLAQWFGEPLLWRVATLRQWLETGQTPYKPKPVTDLPCVFYVHCSGGCDRTGEMIGAYRLRYNGLSWTQMWNEQPCGRPMGCGNYRALQWYAYWLNETLGFKLSGMGEEGGCYDGDSRSVKRLCSPILHPRA
jgi:hypothetical protein